MAVRDLERALEAVPAFRAPRPDLEQYRTPAPVAAGLLRAAADDGAIEGRRVLDLGCGTGVFAVGAALLGAALVTGVDVDADALGEAMQAARAARVEARTTFVAADVRDWPVPTGAFDTVVMNPPFGAQAANRHGDRTFLERAAAAVRPGGTVWFLALAKTEPFLLQAAGVLEARLERVAKWDYPILAQFAFHEKEAHIVKVGGYRMAWR